MYSQATFLYIEINAVVHRDLCHNPLEVILKVWSISRQYTVSLH